jgi:DNA-binding transcriptional ArsR family regulator
LAQAVKLTKGDTLSKRDKLRSTPAAGASATFFAALGDTTRLGLVTRLCDSGPTSITKLSEGSQITRQAITKHLRVMEEAGLLHSTRHGRERLWVLDRRRIRDARRYLKAISRQWDDALDRLRNPIES